MGHVTFFQCTLIAFREHCYSNMWNNESYFSEDGTEWSRCLCKITCKWSCHYYSIYLMNACKEVRTVLPNL